MARLVDAARYVVASGRTAVWASYRVLAVPAIFYFARRGRDDDARPMCWLAQDLGRIETTVLDQEVRRVRSGSVRHRRNVHQVLAHRRPAYLP